MTRDLHSGRRLRDLREAAGWSQAELAKLVNAVRGFNWLQTTVQKIEAGSRLLTLADLEALTEVFDLGLDDLVYGDRIEVRYVADEGRRKALIFERDAIAVRLAEIETELAELQQPPFDVDDRGIAEVMGR